MTIMNIIMKLFWYLKQTITLLFINGSSLNRSLLLIIFILGLLKIILKL